MTTCVSNMLSLLPSSYQVHKARAESQERVLMRAGGSSSRSIKFIKGSLNLRPTFFEVAALKGSVGLPILSPRRKRMDSSVRASSVCSGDASSGPPDSQSSVDASKPTQGVNLFFKLIRRLIPAAVIGVASWLIRHPSIAVASVEAPTFVIGGEAAHGGALSREIAKAGGGLVASAWTGLVAGTLHTLTGPDHLAALAPLCIGRSRLQSFSVGALWGCGHDAGQVIFGIIFLLLKDRLHLDIIQTWAARVVGLMLITVGANGLKEAYEIDAASPVLADGELPAVSVKKTVGPATFITGIVHGLQPDALLMILPALSLPSRAAGAAFLGMFLLGTVLAMGSYTAFVSSLSKALQKRVPKINHQLSLGSSLVAIALGVAVLLGEIFGFNIF